MLKPRKAKPRTGAELRDAGVAAITASKRESIEQLGEIIRDLGSYYPRTGFSSDDVRVELRIRGLEVAHPNAIGAAFRRAALAGQIIAVGYKKSGEPSAHSRVVRVWKAA